MFLLKGKAQKKHIKLNKNKIFHLKANKILFVKFKVNHS